MIYRVFLVLLLAGCAPSMEKLTEEAEKTGDWTAVNARMATIEKEKSLRPESCGRNERYWCDEANNREGCRCVDDEDAQEALRGMGF